MAKSKIPASTVLLRPRVTEKAATMSGAQNVYVFDVTRNATKKSVSASVKAAFNVTPTRVHLLAIPKKEVFVRGKWGVSGGGKKAYIHLKEGDKIEIA